MYEKINNLILKNEMKRIAKKKHERIMIQESADGFILVCIDGFRMHRIYKDYFMIDQDKINHNSNIEKIYNDCVNENDTEAYFTGLIIDTADNGKLIEFKDRKGKYYYYREKFIKEFNKPTDLYLLVNNKKSLAPAIVIDIENNSLDTGLVCPVNYRR